MVIPPSELAEVRKVLGRFNAPKTDRDIFYDVCFTINAPQTTFKKNRPTVEILKNAQFYEEGMPIWMLRDVMKPVRFFNVKSDRLLKAREQMPQILKILRSEKPSKVIRMELKEAVDGFGMKTTSHFLRNQGHEGLAIIDTHILKFLNETSVSGIPKYLALEEAFEKIADGMGVSIAELDTYLWKKYSGTSWHEFTF